MGSRQRTRTDACSHEQTLSLTLNGGLSERIMTMRAVNNAGNSSDTHMLVSGWSYWPLNKRCSCCGVYLLVSVGSAGIKTAATFLPSSDSMLNVEAASCVL